MYLEYTQLLANGLFVGCVTKGHVKCPSFGLATEVHSSKKLKKMIYCGNWRYLPSTYPYRRARTVFNGETKNKVALVQVNASNIIKWGKERETWL